MIEFFMKLILCAIGTYYIFSAVDPLWEPWYKVAHKNITWVDTHQPHDCDFDKAPMGNKECHFDKVITKSGKFVYVYWNKIQED